jgi:hypothetical protein
MPPRYRETFIPSPYPPPSSPMRVKRAAPSPRPRRKAEPPPPPPPIKPFELFAAQFEVPVEGSQDGRVKEYTVDVQQEWDALTPEARLVWEAQYGRQVLEFENAIGTHIEADDSAAWSTDSETDTRRLPLRERVRRKPAKGRVKTSEDGSEKEKSGEEVPPPPKPTAKIMYRTESCKAVFYQFTDHTNH